MLKWLYNHKGCRIKGKEKAKEVHLYTAIYYASIVSKHSRHGLHSFTCKLHDACLSFVSVHQMALPLTEVADIQLQLPTHLPTPKDEVAIVLATLK